MADMLKTVIGDAASGEPRTFDPVQAAKEHPELVSSEMEARLRELVRLWREAGKAYTKNPLTSATILSCADELEAALGRGGRG